MTKINDISTGLKNRDGIWYSEQPSSTFYPEYGNQYTYEYENNSFWYKHRNNCIIQTIKAFPPKDNSIVEIGGGNGYVSAELIKNGNNVILIEPDISGIKNAQKRGITNLICADFNTSQLKKNSLPNICLFDVIEHIENDKSFLNSVYTILKDNGRLYITVPAYNFLFSEEDKHDGHFRRYTRKNLYSLLHDIGFKVEYSTYFFSILPIPIFLLRTLPSICRIKRKANIQKYVSENKHRSGIIGKIMHKIWNREIHIIKNKKKLSFGGSIIMVATKS